MKRIKFKFTSPKGQRILKQMWGVRVPGLWFVPDQNIWVHSLAGVFTKYTTYDTSVKSFKAFKRYIKRHPELYGEKVILVSEYANQDIEAYKNN